MEPGQTLVRISSALWRRGAILGRNLGGHPTTGSDAGEEAEMAADSGQPEGVTRNYANGERIGFGSLLLAAPILMLGQ
jgi:hypothetical protein